MKQEELREEGALQKEVQKSGAETGLTLRAIVVATLFIILGTYVWLDIAYGGIWGLGFRIYWVYYDGYAPNNHAILPILAIIFVINPILKLFKSRFQFSQKEILVISTMTQFGILLIALYYSIIPGAMMGLSIPGAQNPILYGDIAERFTSKFFVSPEETMRWFNEGPGPVPWSEWAIPFISWTLFVFALVGLFFCVGTFLRRRWTEVEHLRYPVGVVKLAYIKGAMEDEPDGSLWGNKLIWIGIVIAFLFSGGSYFHTIWPWFPDTDMNVIRKARDSLWAGNPDLQTAFYLSTTIHPVVMSSMWFVISTDLLFSIWFFYIFRSLLNLVFVKSSSMGLLSGNTASARSVLIHTTIGAQVALAITYLWLARKEIGQAFRKALSLAGGEKVDDSDEPMSYKTAFWGMIGCAVFVVLFCVVVLKMKFLLSVINLLLFIFIAISLARMRNEAGVGPQLSTGSWPIRDSFMKLVGPDAIGMDNVGFGALNNFYHRPFLCYLGGFLEAWKMGDEVGEKRNTVTKSIWLGLFITALAGAFIYVPNMYSLGFNMTMSRNNSVSSYWSSVAAALKQGTYRKDTTSIFWYAYSFIVVILMGWLRTTFAWWPFHPVGFAVGGTFLAQWFVDMAFIVWLVKTIVVRYGGYQTYKKVTPIFLGLGVGQLLASVVGVLLSTLQLLRII
jgi:hypothetical protein